MRPLLLSSLITVWTQGRLLTRSASSPDNGELGIALFTGDSVGLNNKAACPDHSRSRN